MSSRGRSRVAKPIRTGLARLYNYAGDDILARLFSTFTFPGRDGLKPDELAIREAAKGIVTFGDMAIFAISDLARPVELAEAVSRQEVGDFLRKTKNSGKIECNSSLKEPLHARLCFF